MISGVHQKVCDWRLADEAALCLRGDTGEVESAPSTAHVFLPPFRPGTAHVVQFGMIWVE
jgi:hypothetical protein